MSAGCARIRARPIEIAVGCAARCAIGSGCPSPSAWPAPSSSPRWRARSPSPTACCRCRPMASCDFLHPLPVERLWGVGRVTAGKLRERGIITVGDVAELDERALVSMLGPAAGRQLHALAHNRDPRPVQRRTPTPVDRLAARARPAPSRPGRTRSDAGRAGGSGRAAAARRPSGLPDRGAAAALRRLHPGDPIPYASPRRPTTLRRSWLRLASCSPRWRR